MRAVIVIFLMFVTSFAWSLSCSEKFNSDYEDAEIVYALNTFSCDQSSNPDCLTDASTNFDEDLDEAADEFYDCVEG